jgi:hypothetical protein
MPARKKPVDRVQICDPAYVRRIDPVWIPGPVPRRFWEEPRHRRDYLLWLGRKLGFRQMEDWYRLTAKAIGENRGSRLLQHWWSSAIEAVRDCFPDYDWQEWLFRQASCGFWGSRANCRRYLDWLGKQLSYRCLDDWYGITYWDFHRNKGLTLGLVQPKVTESCVKCGRMLFSKLSVSPRLVAEEVIQFHGGNRHGWSL